jgi:hypothetical protein
MQTQDLVGDMPSPEPFGWWMTRRIKPAVCPKWSRSRLTAAAAWR